MYFCLPTHADWEGEREIQREGGRERERERDGEIERERKREKDRFDDVRQADHVIVLCSLPLSLPHTNK